MARKRSDSPPLFDFSEKPDFSVEKKAIAQGLWPLAGADEAGRGPLAGPVVAAAVILDPNDIPDGLDDSKRLSSDIRRQLSAEVLRRALAVSIVSIGATGIDRVNILRASLEAMRRALDALAVRPVHALVDGRDVPPGLDCSCVALVKGDQRSQSIAAASIVAKVARDAMMSNCGRADARYGFELHMGYATARHRAALATYGATPRLHRLSFAPLRLLGASVETDCAPAGKALDI